MTGLFPHANEPAPEGEESAQAPSAKKAPAEAPALYAQVAVDRPMRCEYTYGVPRALAAAVAPGVRVVVPFAGRRSVAVVVGVAETTELAPERVKVVAGVLDPAPVVGEELLELTRWIASYYACSWGEALAAVLPAALKRERARKKVAQLSVPEGIGQAQLATLEERFPEQHRLLRTMLELDGPIERTDLLRRLNLSDSPARTLTRKGWLTLEHVDASPDPLAGGESIVRERPAELFPEQLAAVDAITGPLEAGEYATVLVRGVTGSGKTEVYLRADRAAPSSPRRGAIMLVPEIALTPQTVGWFRSRFGAVAVLHSRISDGERFDTWMPGPARAASCASWSARARPSSRRCDDLGVIVVDEEHEPSFKQGRTPPRYHGRDVAVDCAAKAAGAVCILGSATPSLESWHNAARAGRNTSTWKCAPHGPSAVYRGPAVTAWPREQLPDQATMIPVEALPSPCSAPRWSTCARN